MGASPHGHDSGLGLLMSGRQKGYKPVRTVFVLSFDDPDLAGLEVRCKRVSLAALRSLIDLAAQVEEFDEENPKAGDLGVISEMFGGFAAAIIGWNVLDEDDELVPATAEGLASLDLWFVMKLIEGWITGMMSAPPVSPASSPSGGSSQEELTAAAALSQSLPSSPGPRLLSGCATAGTSCRVRCWRRTPGCSGCWTCTTWATARRPPKTREVRGWPITTSR